MKRSSNKEQEMETKKYVAAFIVEAEVGEKLIEAIGNLPLKFYESSELGPLTKAFMQSYRFDLEVEIPKQQNPNLLKPILKDEE